MNSVSCYSFGRRTHTHTLGHLKVSYHIAGDQMTSMSVNILCGLYMLWPNWHTRTHAYNGYMYAVTQIPKKSSAQIVYTARLSHPCIYCVTYRRRRRRHRDGSVVRKIIVLWPIIIMCDKPLMCHRSSSFSLPLSLSFFPSFSFTSYHSTWCSSSSDTLPISKCNIIRDSRWEIWGN